MPIHNSLHSSMEPAPIDLCSEADGRSLQDVFDASHPLEG